MPTSLWQNPKIPKMKCGKCCWPVARWSVRGETRRVFSRRRTRFGKVVGNSSNVLATGGRRLWHRAIQIPLIAAWTCEARVHRKISTFVRVPWPRFFSRVTSRNTRHRASVDRIQTESSHFHCAWGVILRYSRIKFRRGTLSTLAIATIKVAFKVAFKLLFDHFDHKCLQGVSTRV